MSAGTTHEYGDVQKRQAQFNAALKGGAKGGAAGLSVLLPTAYILNQRWAPFKQLPFNLKAFFMTTGTIVSAVIAADKSGIKFDREHYTDEGAQKMRQYASREDKEWAELSPQDKALTWTKENKFSIVAGSWAASMAGVFAYIHNQPIPFTQKIVQVRVWAQGITLATLVGLAAVTSIKGKGDHILEEREHASDHSWKDFVGDSNADPAKGGSNKDQYGRNKPVPGSAPKEHNRSEHNKSEHDNKSSNKTKQSKE